jgi:hypothetical protein
MEALHIVPQNPTKNIVLKGNQSLKTQLEKALSRKDEVKKLIQRGASVDEIRKIAPLS